MVRRWWKPVLIGVIAAPLLAWGCDRVYMIHWVGTTDLEVVLTVTDAATGAPVPRARVEVQSEGGFYEERDKQEFVLIAGADGVANKECRRSMCFGTQSGLRFTNTYVVHLPWWRFRVVAEGYESGEWTELDVPEHIRQARQAGPGKAKLVVPVTLQKRHAEQGAAAARAAPHGTARHRVIAGRPGCCAWSFAEGEFPRDVLT
jgi:hypothetical protein